MTYRATPADGFAWVTGASSGIGRAVALELAGRGFRVVATARDEERLAAVVAAAAGLPGAMVSRPCDVTERDAMVALHAAIEREQGPVALAILNAGGVFADEPASLGGQGTRRTLALNLDGTLNAFEPAARAMSTRGRGQIAIVASLAGYRGFGGDAAYGASKAALNALAESWRRTLARRGVTLQVVNPGFVRTPLTVGVRMPKALFLDVDDAARRICDGLARGGFEVAFPRRLVWPARLLRALPPNAFVAFKDWIAARRRGGRR
ncbi:MAG: SDR family NAD(P)-dependent oxidoreductase [Hyphomicrobiales bacterium]|nr:SDR family NAD(P)-dependent oxidoreductase [Hyphomicrobiales bacterium]MDE2016772.1 SDR family NAD(P)-dependent oxidoreductase [Hyphomicrobiales bacterium]